MKVALIGVGMITYDSQLDKGTMTSGLSRNITVINYLFNCVRMIGRDVYYIFAVFPRLQQHQQVFESNPGNSSHPTESDV